MKADLPFLTRRTQGVAWRLLELHKSESASKAQKRWSSLALRYYISRWDLIPDFLPGIGMVDDYLLLALVEAFVDPPDVAIPPEMKSAEIDQAIELGIRGKIKSTAIAS